MSDVPGEAAPQVGPPPTARSVALVAVGQLALMGFGGLLAILIAQSFGKTRSTDAFFAAYGVYSLGQVIASSLRFSSIPVLVGGDRAALPRTLAGSVVLSAVIAVPVLLCAEPISDVLVANDPAGIAPTALRILGVAIAAQLVSAVILAGLAVRGAYGSIAFVTGTTGLVTVVAFLVLEGSLGIDAASVALAASSSYMLCASLFAMRRAGLSVTAAGALAGSASAAGRLLWSSMTFFGPALAYLAALAVATRQAKGDATLLSYAYVMSAMLVAVTSYVTASLRSPAITAGDQRTEAALDAAGASVRATVVLVGPLIAALAIAGGPILRLLLGDDFSAADVGDVLENLIALSGWLLATAVGVFATVELLARSALGTLAWLAALLAAGTAITAIAANAVAGSVGIAVALSLAALAVALLQSMAAFPDGWAGLWMQTAGWVAKEMVLIAAAGLPYWLVLVFGGSNAAVTACGLTSVVLILVTSARAWPVERTLVVSMFRAAPRPASSRSLR